MIHDATKYSFNTDSRILFDANIWLTLFAPPSNPDEDWKKEYSKVLNEIVNKKAKIFLDDIVLGEYVNRFCRMEFDVYRKEFKIDDNSMTFKQFRDTKKDYFQPIVEDVSRNVEEILEIGNLKMVNMNWGRDGLLNVCNVFSKGNSDWNDLLLVEICRQNSCAILTNDADFWLLEDGVDVLTANPRLLKRKS